jgi:outer membrane protein assembly factor BamB
VPVPAFHDGVLYASRGYRSGPYFAVRTGGRGDVSKSHVSWSVATGAPYIASLLHYQDLIYMANDAGIVTAVDPKTGEKVWQERIAGIFTASPVAAEGRVYLVSETGETIVLQAGREALVLARNAIGERTAASPALADGRIFLRTDDHLVAIGPAR